MRRDPAGCHLPFSPSRQAIASSSTVASGDIIVVRYADDLVVGFQHRTDAERFLKEFRERLAKFGLELHPDKTRLIEFGRFAARNRQQRGEGKPETFTFLGFTHYCGQRQKSGTFTVCRITAKKRMVAKLKAIKAELQRRMHDRMANVGVWLRKVVLGYYQYHAVPGNTTQLRIFKLRVCRLWQSVLSRRSQRAKMRWERFTPVLNRWMIASVPLAHTLTTEASRCKSQTRLGWRPVGRRQTHRREWAGVRLARPTAL